MQCIVVNIDELENSYPLLCNISPLNPDYAAAARSAATRTTDKELEVKFTFSFVFIRNHIAKAKLRAF